MHTIYTYVGLSISGMPTTLAGAIKYNVHICIGRPCGKEFKGQNEFTNR